MTYDSNQWDEEARRLRAERIPCEDCDRAFATVELETLTGDRLGLPAYLCESCAEKREQAAAEQRDEFNDRVDHEFDRWHDQ